MASSRSLVQLLGGLLGLAFVGGRNDYELMATIDAGFVQPGVAHDLLQGARVVPRVPLGLPHGIVDEINLFVFGQLHMFLVVFYTMHVDSTMPIQFADRCMVVIGLLDQVAVDYFVDGDLLVL